MSAHDRFEASIGKARWWQGESISIDIQVSTRAGEPSVSVPVPFAPTDPDVRVFVSRDDGPEVSLMPDVTHPSPRVSVPPSDILMTELTLGDDFARDPGVYTMRVEWADHGSQTLSFEVVSVHRMTLTTTRTEYGEAPVVHALGTVSGPGLGALVEHRYEVSVEEISVYERTFAATQLSTDSELEGAIGVHEAQDSLAWFLGWDARGLLARPGWEVEGFARHDWPEGLRPTLVRPALERDDGRLRALLVDERGEAWSIDFSPPRIEEESPQGSDDWDDEFLVPGDVQQGSLGRLNEGSVLGARAIQSPAGVMLVATAKTALVHAMVRGEALEQPRALELPGEVLSPEPELHVGDDGIVSAAVVVARDTPDGHHEIGLVVVRLEPGVDVNARWLGVLREDVVEAAIALAPDPNGQPRVIAALRSASGWLCLGDEGGHWSARRAPEGLLSPLMVTAAAGVIHVAVHGDHGPSLLRLA